MARVQAFLNSFWNMILVPVYSFISAGTPCTRTASAAARPAPTRPAVQPPRPRHPRPVDDPGLPRLPPPVRRHRRAIRPLGRRLPHRRSPVPRHHDARPAFRTFQGWTARVRHGPLNRVSCTRSRSRVHGQPQRRARCSPTYPTTTCAGSPSTRSSPASRTGTSRSCRPYSIPDIRAGDSVWWHCDMIHSVAPVKNQQGWGNVMYIPAAPWCPRNEQYAASVRRTFPTGSSPEVLPRRTLRTRLGQPLSRPTPSSTTPADAAAQPERHNQPACRMGEHRFHRSGCGTSRRNAGDHALMALIGLLSMRAAPEASGFEHDLADVLALQDPAVGCRCFGEGVDGSTRGSDLVLLPEREDRLESAQQSHLPPQVADVDAARPSGSGSSAAAGSATGRRDLGGEAGGAAALPAGQVQKTERDQLAARPQQIEALLPVIAAERVEHDVHALAAG